MQNLSRILIASNGHKGILGPIAACSAIGDGLAGIGAELLSVPMADGGDGLIEALLFSLQGEVTSHVVHDSLYRTISARLALVKTANGPTAIIEIADAAGSARLAPHERQTMMATSYGVGELILEAVKSGYHRVIVGLGGGITTDCGMGLAQALGIKFLGRDGKALHPVCCQGFNALSLVEVGDVDMSGLKIDLEQVEILVAADVDIPLLGPHGQAFTFGPQKGASELEIAYFERGLANLSNVIQRRLGRDVDIPMAGAAGGMAAGLLGFLGARLQLGAELVAHELDLESKISASDLLIVGEGKMDRSTFHHKAPHFLAEMAQSCGVPVVAVVGKLEHESLLFQSIYSGDDFEPANLDAALATMRLRRAASELREKLMRQFNIISSSEQYETTSR